jgi:hypothetical protein
MAESTTSNPPELEPDPFLRLHKMSTTAGLGSGDYVAINGRSLAALLMGIASCLVLWGSLLLLIIPAISLICGFVAIKQIRSSNGTQTGRGLAMLGIFLSLAMGGGFTGNLALESVRNARQEQQVVSLLQEFGALIRDAKYAQAYDLCDGHFRDRITEAKFTETWQQANGSMFRGPITGATYNGILKFADDPLTGDREANGVMLISFTKIPAKERQDVILSRQPDGWRLDQLPEMFPVESAPDNSSRPPSQREGSGPIGPPAPPK